MTKFSKLLAIFVTVASLVFVGFAIAATFGGPDWAGVMQEDYFQGYKISKSDGPDASWSATRASDDGQVATSKVLPEVLSKVMDEVQQKQQAELSELQAAEPVLTARIAALTAIEELDEKALDQYISAMRDRIAALAAEEAKLTSKVTADAVNARKLERLVESRREDVFRLRQQVKELEADLFRLQEIRTQLHDYDFQLQALLGRAKERHKLLTGE